VGSLIASGEAIWAVASPDWDEQRRGGRPDGKRPVVWEQASEAEIARHRDMIPYLGLGGARPLEDEVSELTVAQWRESDGDYEDLEAATPIWRIRAGGASRIQADLTQPMLAPAEGKLVGVCRLPGDPIIKHLEPGGSVSWRYPGTVIVIDDTGTLEAVGPVPGSGGVVCTDHGIVWLLGFEGETHDEPAPEVREVLVTSRRVGAALGVRPRNPVTVLDRFVVDLAAPEPAGDSAADRAHGSAVVRFLPTDGGEPWTAGSADLARSALARAWGGEVWIGNPGGSTLVAAAPGRAGLRELRISLDCRPWMPRPQLPAGFGSREFEHELA
jgi:hypothetical protein